MNYHQKMYRQDSVAALGWAAAHRRLAAIDSIIRDQQIGYAKSALYVARMRRENSVQIGWKLP